MEQQALEGLVREILAGDYVSLHMDHYTLSEDVDDKRAAIVGRIAWEGGGQPREIEGRGVGLVDALFNALKNSLSHDYPSLNHVHFVGFNLKADFSGSGNDSRSDAMTHVEVTVENTSGRRFSFTCASPSVTASSVAAVVEMVEHFMNAETAVLRIYDWIEDARSRGRPELAERYTRRLSDLVKNATYSESIERRR